MEGDEVNAMCRLCLGKNGDLIYIFESKRMDGWTAADGILELLQIQVSEDDSYPQCVCDLCMEKMEDFKLFKDRCQSNREWLDGGYGGISGVASHEHEMEFVDEMKPLISQWEAEKLAAAQDERPSGNQFTEDEEEDFKLFLEDEDVETAEAPSNPIQVQRSVKGGPCSAPEVDNRRRRLQLPLKNMEKLRSIKVRLQADGKLTILRTRKGSGDVQRTDACSSSNKDPDVAPVLSTLTTTIAEEQYGVLLEAISSVCNPEGVDSGENECSKEEVFSSVQSVDDERPESTSVLRVLRPRTSDSKKEANVTGKKSGSQRHLKMVHKIRGSLEHKWEETDKKFERKSCGMRFAAKSNLRKHIELHLGGERSKSEGHLGNKLVGRGTLVDTSNSIGGKKRKGLKSVRGSEGWTCEVCKKKFKNRISLVSHRRNHREKSFKCGACNKGFTDKSKLGLHERTHSGEKPFSCGDCGRRFALKGPLKIHLRIHTGETPYECNECRKAFKNLSALRQHQLIHSGEKAFSCGDCGRRFTLKSNLKVHLRIHSGEKPFGCNECKKSFTQRSILQQHQLIHSGEKPFSCGDCGGRFARKCRLISHLRTHTGERPYKCKSCNKGFRRNDTLRSHERIHKNMNVK